MGWSFVCGDEPIQAVEIHATVYMRDQLQGHDVGARRTGVGRAGQPRQLSAVRRRQISAGQPDLILNQIEIVQQPLCRRRDAPIAGHRGGDQVIGLDENAFVVVQARNQMVAAASFRHLVQHREAGGMARQLVDAEQLGPQRRLVFAQRWPGQPASSQSAKKRTCHRSGLGLITMPTPDEHPKEQDGMAR